MRSNKLMVVAHPDDEAIFGGAQLLKKPGWKVICVTNGDHRVRRREFIKVMKRAGAAYEIWSFPDQWKGDFDRKALKEKLKKELASHSYKKIVTHNKKGEYGHTQHIALSQIMHSLVKKNLHVFKKGKKIMPLTLLKKKLDLLMLYPSQRSIIEMYKKEIMYEALKKVN
ncbi:PIG-L family deacetylase [Brevibacillus fluminis]|uniref:PIG-L family deacetylase n=1 Tax=Brevibacillus fluminis TaxID=511487 RepID=A0A3M8DXQ3_9BACL|nr:PIG-L family deacetylase [Brevibacillus fluminis]RNB92325.1 PIG-L family deacetylase [Brevibacillus fluminis]